MGLVSFRLSQRRGNRIFRSVFLKTTAIASIVRRVCDPMLLAEVAVFLGTSLLLDSGTVDSTRSLRTFLLAVRSFCIARSVGLFGSFCGHIRAQLPQEREGVNACPQESHLSREG